MLENFFSVFFLRPDRLSGSFVTPAFFPFSVSLSLARSQLEVKHSGFSNCSDKHTNQLEQKTTKQ